MTKRKLNNTSEKKAKKEADEYSNEGSKVDYHVFTDDPDEKEVQRRPQPIQRRIFRFFS